MRVFGVRQDPFGSIICLNLSLDEFIGTDPFWYIEVDIGERRMFSRVTTLGQLIFIHLELL